MSYLLYDLYEFGQKFPYYKNVAIIFHISYPKDSCLDFFIEDFSL